MEFSAQQIASLIQGTVVGDASVKVCNFSKIEEGKPGTLSFLANPKYEQYIYMKPIQALYWLIMILNHLHPFKQL